MSANGHSEWAGPDPGSAAETKLTCFAVSVDVDLTELAGPDDGDAIVLTLIVLRGPAEARERAPGGSPHRRPIGWFDLTDRERAVADLAGRAFTNQQIATRLGISPHTVNFHLRQIFRKLGIASRVQLARLPAERSAADADIRPTQSGF